MTMDGNHGGSSDLEMHTTFFAYQKEPFPLGKKYRAMEEQFREIDRMTKQVDMAMIGALVLNTPFPFSSFGIGHPMFAQSDDFSEVIRKLRDNLS